MRTIRPNLANTARVLTLCLIVTAGLPASAGTITPDLKDALVSAGPDDFVGESTFGTWTLSVQDTAYGTFGAASIQGFTLHVTAEGAFECDVLTCAEPAPTESPDVLLVDKVVDPAGRPVSRRSRHCPSFKVRATNACNQESP